jgi:hypothetical protein
LGRSNEDLKKRNMDDLKEIAQALKAALGVQQGRNGNGRSREEMLGIVVSLRRSVRKGIKAGRIAKRDIPLSIALPGLNGKHAKIRVEDERDRRMMEQGYLMRRSD